MDKETILKQIMKNGMCQWFGTMGLYTVKRNGGFYSFHIVTGDIHGDSPFLVNYPALDADELMALL